MDLRNIENKQDKIAEDIYDIKIILEKQNSSLEHHIYRTQLAEENIALIRKELDPIQDHVIKIQGIYKFLTVMGSVIVAIIGAAASIYAILNN